MPVGDFLGQPVAQLDDELGHKIGTVLHPSQIVLRKIERVDAVLLEKPVDDYRIIPVISAQIANVIEHDAIDTLAFDLGNNVVGPKGTGARVRPAQNRP